MGGMDSKTLFLPGALADSPLGVLFLDKALKRARAEGLEVRGVTRPARPSSMSSVLTPTIAA